MGEPAKNPSELDVAARRVVQSVLITGENRLSLFKLELEEERDRILQVIMLSLAIATFGLLAGIAATVGVVLFFWDRAPMLAVVVLAVLYAACAAWFYALVRRIQRNWQTLPGTIEQLQKDRECLATKLA